jgi:hypothetical protein
MENNNLTIVMNNNNCNWQSCIKFEYGMISMSVKCQTSLMAMTTLK